MMDSASGHVICSPTWSTLDDWPPHCGGVALTMPHRKAFSGQLKQQSLTGFLRPNSSKANNPRNSRSRTKPGSARLPRRISPQLSEPSDQSGTDSDVDAIHFEPKEVIISDDDDIQPSSPVRKRR